MGVFEVAGNERPEAFLTRSIPKLQSVVFGLVADVLGEEVNADCGLD
jgi:hypothetical protein